MKVSFSSVCATAGLPMEMVRRMVVEHEHDPRLPFIRDIRLFIPNWQNTASWGMDRGTALTLKKALDRLPERVLKTIEEVRYDYVGDDITAREDWVKPTPSHIGLRPYIGQRIEVLGLVGRQGFIKNTDPLTGVVTSRVSRIVSPIHHFETAERLTHHIWIPDADQYQFPNIGELVVFSGVVSDYQKEIRDVNKNIVVERLIDYTMTDYRDIRHISVSGARKWLRAIKRKANLVD